ncbi:MAG: hypothetical protein ACOX7C_05215 [Brevefilum sp.]
MTYSKYQQIYIVDKPIQPTGRGNPLWLPCPKGAYILGRHGDLPLRVRNVFRKTCPYGCVTCFARPAPTDV